ncbi:MAG: flagellar motor protein MotB [Candidatus Saelkia tenebricola]|nr:flagellar motor protein MotB [Candidatus Saelkia tenebricola]
MKGRIWMFLVASSILMSGCAVTFKKTPPEEIEKMQLMKKELQRLRIEVERIKSEKSEEVRELEEARDRLARRFQKEIEDKDLKLSLEEKGLVLRFVAEVFFDSGKAELREEAYPMLNKVAKFLTKDVPGRDVSIEGHTDDDPIKYSGWTSNWELSAARAISVLYYLVDEKKVDSKRVQATGFGEYQPIASNSVPEGKQKNRRVEIVILPKKLTKIREGFLDDLGKVLEERERRIREYAK